MLQKCAIKTGEKWIKLTPIKNSLEVQCSSHLRVIHIWACQGIIWAMLRRAFTNSCNFLIDHLHLLRAASHSTLHPTSCAIFATKSALSTSAQLASSDSLPILKMISFSWKTITTILQRIFSKLDSKSFSCSLHKFTKHKLSTSSPIVTKALLPTLSLQTPTGGVSSTYAQPPRLSL